MIVAVAVCTAYVRGQPVPTEQTAPTEKTMAMVPYLQVLSPESIAVLWRTDQPAYGWVEYGGTKELGHKQDAVVNGLRVANVTEHRVVLIGLRPGATYWYRICSKPITRFEAYKVVFAAEQRSEVMPMHTLPSPDQRVGVVIFNDLHNNTATFDQLRRVVDQTPFDFSVFNGDCLADPKARTPTVATLDAYLRGVGAANRPAVFLRGNHETRGAFARELPELLAWPGTRPYFSFSAGPVRFVMLDCGEDKPDDHAEYFGLTDFDSFRIEQARWLEKEVASSAFRTAAWRVLVHHIPLHKSSPRGGSTYSEPSHRLWAPLLAGAQIDVAVHGHTHRPAFHPLNDIENPYPLFVGGGPQLTGATVVVVEADSRRLNVRMVDASGREVCSALAKTR